MGMREVDKMLKSQQGETILKNVIDSLWGLDNNGNLEMIIDDEEITDYYVKEVVDKLKPLCKTKDTSRELEKGVRGYLEEILKWATYYTEECHMEDLIKDRLVEMDKNKLGLVYFQGDPLVIIETSVETMMMDNPKKFVQKTLLEDLSQTSKKPVRQYIMRNYKRILVECSKDFEDNKFKGVLLSLQGFSKDLDFEKIIAHTRCGGRVAKLIRKMDAVVAYENYLSMIDSDEPTDSKGKDDAINYLARMYPKKFEGIGNKKYVDLGGCYLCWQGKIRVIHKMVDNTTRVSTKQWSIDSTSKDMILAWFDYNDLYREFY